MAGLQTDFFYIFNDLDQEGKITKQDFWHNVNALYNLYDSLATIAIQAKIKTLEVEKRDFEKDMAGYSKSESGGWFEDTETQKIVNDLQRNINKNDSLIASYVEELNEIKVRRNRLLLPSGKPEK